MRKYVCNIIRDCIGTSGFLFVVLVIALYLLGIWNPLVTEIVNSSLTSTIFVLGIVFILACFCLYYLVKDIFKFKKFLARQKKKIISKKDKVKVIN
ncbi:MAG: hypothetical protein NT052_00170 [Candidatus Shapirobacteria bacterium]|nr:hypothetical protein [Candidatus Shapirobacteria bacterium]